MTKEALTLALEALELHEKIMHPYCDQQTERALKAIEEALQSNEQELDYKAIGQQAYESGYSTGYMDCAVKMKAQPEQEPVAYIHRNEYNEYRLEPHDNFDIKSIPFNVDVSLFKSPQRTWVGLTDEEIENVWDSGVRAFPLLARELEAKLKEKNNG